MVSKAHRIGAHLPRFTVMLFFNLVLGKSIPSSFCNDSDLGLESGLSDPNPNNYIWLNLEPL